MHLTTPRLTIRPMHPDDAAAVAAYMTDGVAMEYFHGSAMPFDEVVALVAANSDPATATAFVLVPHGQTAPIGHLNFHRWHQPRTYEIGWAVHPAAQGQGYATEGAGAVRDYAFGTLGAHRLIATAQPENPASWRVMEKLGMRREAHFVRCIHRGGDHWWDEYFYALLAEEWRCD